MSPVAGEPLSFRRHREPTCRCRIVEACGRRTEIDPAMGKRLFRIWSAGEGVIDRGGGVVSLR